MKRTLLLALLALSRSALADSSKHITLEEFRQVRLPDVVLESVTVVESEGQKKSPGRAHVVVKGIIGAEIRFELLLPDQWNERFVMGGGGGFVGTVQNGARDSVNKGYATAGTDTGHHSASGYLAGWALDNLEAKVNFGHLAVHRTAEVAKALIRAYYRVDPSYSYFTGCSRGGGQAMMEAQRYPNDFDGIVAGAPAFDWTGIAATMVTIAKTLYPDPTHLESNVLTKDALQKLAQSIMEQCDEQDGLKDGIIQNPAAAHFDLSKVPDLTDEQRKAIATIFEGARTVKGLIYPGFAPVSEVSPDQWIAWIVGPVPGIAKDHVADASFAFGTQIFKYLIFNEPDWNYATYDFSNFARDARLAASYLNATNADMSAFKDRKGKLVIWHGWADPALPAQATIDYYRKVMEHDSNATDYCRLFLVPGCFHCGGGPGPAEVDWLSVITDWVENNQAPEKLVASKHEGGKLVMARPLFSFPATAAYKGSGDANSAESFEAKR